MKHIPNLLSTFRIVLIPFYFAQIMSKNMLNAGIVLIVSGFTDFLDGLLARKFNWITDLGKVLDPIADKLTQTAISLSFIFLLDEYAIFFWIILIKDAAMMLVSAWLIRKGAKLEGANMFGKVSTFIFYVVMIVMILFPNIPGNIKTTMMVAVVGAALVAWLMYVPAFLELLHKIKHDDQSV